MPSNLKNFKPKKLKAARIALEKHLQMHIDSNDEYKRNMLKEATLWGKIRKFFS